MMRARWLLVAALAVFTLADCTPKHARDYSGWGAYGGGNEQIKYSSLTEITPENVANLDVAWTYDTGADATRGTMHSTPLLADGRLFLAGPDGSIHAVNPATGERLWRYSPQAAADGDTNTYFRGAPRGLMYWRGELESRVYGINGRYVFALDAETGALVQSFGAQGQIDLRQDLGRDPDTSDAELGTPGVIYKDVIILGSRMGEVLPTSPGHIRAYDARTGALRWTFHTIPHPGEAGYETWPANAWTYSGGANAWSGFSLDEARGVVYVPTGSAASDFYGADRIGDNLYANSLIALNAETGERIWHQQLVRHDLWDRDLPAPPSLVTITRNGRRIDALAQTTKSGHIWLLDRDTGEPLFPVDEVPAAASTVPGEVAAQSQRVPRLPVPFAEQHFTVTNRTPAAHAAVSAQIRGMDELAPFTPPSLAGRVVYPGFDGGGEWGGGAFDPETGLFYVNANEVPWMLRLIANPDRASLTNASDLFGSFCASCHGGDRRGSGDFPSLIDVGQRRSQQDIRDLITNGAGRMPGFAAALDAEAISALAAYVGAGRNGRVNVDAVAAQPFDTRYRNDGWPKLLDPEGYPGSTPPWGTLTAIDLSTGQHVWRIPLGEYPALAAQGQSDTGSENYGGPVVTAGGLVFIGATVADHKFRAFDKRTGALLWEHELPASAIGTPAVYEAGGRQFIVTAAGGPRTAGEPRGSTYVAFALPAGN